MNKLKIINQSSKELPLEFLNSIFNNDNYEKYQQILTEYNLKIYEFDLVDNQIQTIIITDI